MRNRTTKAGTLAWWGALLTVICLFLLVYDGHAASSKKKTPGTKDGMTAMWAFGHSEDRHNPLWQRANSVRSVVKKTDPQKFAREKGVMDTSSGIDRALDVANNEKKGRHFRTKANIGMSMDNQSSAWKVSPGEMRADEYMPRDNRHVVRAYAGLKAGEEFDIRVGPELILRDESKGVETAHEKQPDSSIGVGMRFKVDF